ncbi:hypothetical protein HB779_02025 [Phyllobacterium sp. 628]|uniref:hypothetical protein n=1 Tax=Phyllobacterium sp. 628 TaxID=2718938 RepID=UPI0016621D30|nr:hypothetical protein [Phyllobacterium sp. 628]QND50799.1 hypothetical protein HB779_02025 [Phyllobacterium sp. 628]
MNDDPNDLGLMTLKEACEKLLGGRLTPSSLRTEAEKGNLEIIQIARKDFVTKEGIREMVEKCRSKPTARAPVVMAPRAPVFDGKAAQAALFHQLNKKKNK